MTSSPTRPLQWIRAALPDRSLLYWSLSWCIAVFLMAYWVKNPFFLVFLAIPILAVGTALFAIGLWRGWLLRHSPVPALSTALLFPLVIWIWPFIPYAAAQVHFLQDRRIYEEIIKLEKRGDFRRGLVVRHEHRGVEFAIDGTGRVKRFAFTTNPGIVDNWTAVIYDPSDEVRLAQGMYTTPPRVRELFGGDIVTCRNLANHYYNCSFT